MSPKLKVAIPNILTATRLVFTPIIIILGLTKNYKVALILAVIACISDLFDGKLARKWNTVTEFGAKLDALSDKVFAIGLIICLISKNKLFSLLVILECLIGIFNLYTYNKTGKTKSLMIGKIKTCILFTTICVGFIYLYTKIPTNLISGLILATANIQVLTLINYIVEYYDYTKNKELAEAIVNDKGEKRTQIFDQEEFEKKDNNDKQEEDFTTKTIKLKHIKDIFLEDD